MFVGPLEARKMAFVVGYKKWLKRSRDVADFQAFLKPYFSTFMAMFKLAQKRRFWSYELDPNMFCM